MLVVCAVSRWQRRSSFDVNARGVLNALTAAIACGHERFITTGPHWTLFGAQEQLALNYGINEENVPHPGAGLYGITKGLGLEIARVYSSHFRAHPPPPLWVLLPSSFRFCAACRLPSAHVARWLVGSDPCDVPRVQLHRPGA